MLAQHPRPSAFATSLLLALAALTATAPAAAQAEPSVDVRGFRASADPGAGIYLEPASSPATGDWNAALWLSYAHRPFTLEDAATGETRFDVLRHQLSADLAASIGIAGRAALGFDLPLVAYQSGDAPTEESRRVLGDTALPGTVLGDLGLVGKLTLVRPTGGEFGGFALALHERFTLPTGHESSWAGEGAVTSETRLLAEYRLVALGLHLAAGGKLRAEQARVACESTPLTATGSDPCPTRFGHEIPFGLGLSLKPQAFGVDQDGRVTLFLETHGYLPIAPIAPFQSGRVAAAQLGLGARYALRDVSLMAGAETALAGGVGNPPLRVMASVVWAPREHDIDDDGVDDDVDQCRELPEDRDGYQDGDGCPEGDNDEDGVVDDEDQCQGKKEDEDSFQDEDGCPDPDNDLDLVLDAADACPDAREDRDGFEDDDGCPEPDNDEDGILDAKDACPRAPEIIDGKVDEDGCPEPGARSRIRWTGDLVVVENLPRFTPASARMPPDLEAGLRMAAQLIRGRLPVESIIIEAYPDRAGDGSDRALALAAARADAVKALLVAAGIPADRITAAAGDTSARRAPNAPQVDITVMRARGPAARPPAAPGTPAASPATAPTTPPPPAEDPSR